MHQFDPNGAIHEYRMRRDRRELGKTIAFAVFFAIAGLCILAGVFISFSVWGK